LSAKVLLALRVFSSTICLTIAKELGISFIPSVFAVIYPIGRKRRLVLAATSFGLFTVLGV